MSTPSTDLFAEIREQRTRSYEWLKNNYWDEWVSAFKNYKCMRDPAMDDNDPTKIDETQTAIGMPDTWAMVRRHVARVTAQPPSLKFRADDPAIADKISRTLMYQWDKGGIQRVQKRHVTQAAIFGWSVRPWYWESSERMRKRRVSPFDANVNPDDLAEIQKQYADKIAEYAAQGMEPSAILAQLAAEVGRGGLIPIQYSYKPYQGPKADFLFIGDCFPEPNFQTIQSSNWFIVARRRNEEWFRGLAKLYPEASPEGAQMRKGIQELFDKHPDGSPRSAQGRVPEALRTELLAVSDRVDEQITSQPQQYAKEWTVYERHIPGANPRLGYMAEDDVSIGEIPHPYDLDGKIPFTELVFIDDMMAGIGDSNARMTRGLQDLHNRNTNQRSDLIDAVMRPLYWTSDRKLFDNPELVRRGKGFSLIHSDRGINGVGEQAALAAAAGGANDENGIMRMFQLATGESNMSMAANVDPQQARTATGARIMAYSGDVLSKDAIDMLTLSIRDDLDMMYLLNRSEMTEDTKFDKNRYSRNYLAADAQTQQQQAPEIMTATPLDFQYDGEVEAEVASTLADDDDAVLSKAQTIFQAATQHPDLFNVEKARNDFLIAMGKGKDLQAYLPPPPGPPPQPEPKASANYSFRGELLPPAAQVKILNATGVDVTPEDMGMPPAGPMPGVGGPPMPPGMTPSPGPPGAPQPPSGAPVMLPQPLPEMPPAGAGAYQAALGHNPLAPQ